MKELELTPKEKDLVEILVNALIKGIADAPESEGDITVKFADEDLLAFRERLSRE